MFFALLFFRRHSLPLPSLLHRTTNASVFASVFPKLSSTLSSSDTTTPSEANKSSSLSARMSFVFDQIDAIEKERSQKDDTLQRIRSRRESKRNKDFTTEEIDHPQLGRDSPDSTPNDSKLNDFNSRKAVELVHPWPEWIELMERLVHQNYFDHKRKDENKMVEGLGFDVLPVKEEAFDFIRDWKTVQTACLNFGKDRFDILRSLSRQDIQVLVGFGCASTDKKVVFSSKLLRKHVHLNEGDVCSSCNLRGSCERGYLLTNKEDEARTIDIMRVLQVYGFDPLNGSVMNESLLKKKTVKTVVRKMIHEVVKLSSVPIDPNLPPPVIKKPPPKVKIPPPPPRRRVGRDDIEMKKGDWLCPKCDFMNFAKNSACLQCDASRPQRQLLPGEWECPGCNFLNYRRNMACFHCDHKRPPDEFTENQMQEKQRGPCPMRSDNKIPNKSEISNAWNFDFDDNESDGADVAAFEHADSRLLDQDFPQEERTIRAERGYSVPVDIQPGIGFNDFDEDDDDLETYELDTPTNTLRTSSVDFSELEVDSGSDDSDGRTRSSNPGLRKVKDEIAFDLDDELLIHPNWKSSHVANSGNRDRNRKSGFGSEDYEDEFRSRQNIRGDTRGGRRAMDDYDVALSGSDIDEDSGFRGGRGNKVGLDKRRSSFKGRDDFDGRGGSQLRSRSSGFGGNDDFEEHGGSQFRSRSKGFGGNDDYNERKKSSPRRESFGDKRGGRSVNFDNRGGRSESIENGKSRNFDDRGGRSRNFEGGKSRNFDVRGGRSRNSDSRGGRSGNFDKRGSKDSYVVEDIPLRPRNNVR